MTIKDIIKKYKLPRATKGVQVSPTLGIVEFTKGVVHKVYPDAQIMYINNKIKIYPESETDMDLIINDGMWILCIPVKSENGISYSLVATDEEGMENGVLDSFASKGLFG